MLDAVYTGWSLPHTKTTVLQDWEKGRRCEVEQVNGYVVDRATAVGLGAPLNSRIVEVASEIESGALERGISNLPRLLA